MTTHDGPARWRLQLRWACTLLFGALSLGFIVLPALSVGRLLLDPSWRTGAMSPAVVEWHERLSERIGPWARERIATSRATQLDTFDVSGTEWPMFTAVFYLWATEAVQEHCLHSDSCAGLPARRDADAIAAVADLIADPGHATWVRAHWGEGYRNEHDLFYRMLLVAGLDSYERLSGDETHRPLLESQARSLAAELDASPYGLVEDYPGETYTVDVAVAYAVLARARERLGIPDDGWTSRGARAFASNVHDVRVALPAYRVDAAQGLPLGPARGVGLSMMLTWAKRSWPEESSDWYRRYVDAYWQERLGFAGFREFAVGSSGSEWMVEVDAGPVFAGYGTAASAFGIAATRANGDMDRAFALTSEALLAAWPMPDGTLLLPRVLSNATDSPYTGEAALLFALTRPPAPGAAPATRAVPPGVWVVIFLALAFGIGEPSRRLVTLLRATRVATKR